MGTVVMVGKRFLALFALGMSLGLAGCGMPVKQVPVGQSLEVPNDNSNFEPIRFERMVVDIKRGTVLGKFRVSPLCSPVFAPITSETGRFNNTSAESRDLVFRELTAAGYKVTGDPSILFDVKDERATYGLAGRVKEMQLDLCQAIDFWFGHPVGIEGSAYTKVQWQVMDTLTKKIVFDITTEGSFNNPQPSGTGDEVAILGAIGNAAANLAHNPEFRQLITRDRSKDRQPHVKVHDGPSLSLRGATPFTSGISGHMDRVRSAVVTVLVEGGHGSGYFISPSGFVLTNRHVVGDAKLVKVRLLSGREVIGEVLRRHEQRDVALIKVEESGYPALPVRSRPVEVGEDLYAIGTPLGESNANTLSKGIVSALRTDSRTGLERIQGDVMVQPGSSGGPLVDSQGNLVGMTVSGADIGGVAVGLNYFIPIQDALAKLKLKIDPKKQDDRVNEDK